MKLEGSADERKLLAAVRAFVSDWRLRAGSGPFPTAYFEALLARGWSVPLWPARWGGGVLTVEEAYLVDQALILAGGTTLPPQMVTTIGPLLMWAADEQSCERWLPAMARGHARWCSHGSLVGGPPVEGHLAPGRFLPASAELRATDAQGADCLMALATDGSELSLIVTELLPEAVLPGASQDPDRVLTRPLSFERVGPLLSESEFRQQIEQLRSGDAVRSCSHAARLRWRLLEVCRLYQALGEDLPRELVELDVTISGLLVLERRALLERSVTFSEVLSVRALEVGQSLSHIAVQALGYHVLPAPDQARQHNELSARTMAGQDAIGELIRYVGGLEAITARDRIAALELLSLRPAGQQGE